ncbi:MAG: methyltransferase [Erysipelotrichaceae bacterium]
MSHYFTDNRQLAQNRKEISFRFSCFNYLFTTDNGVFSKGNIDEGTQILLNTIINDINGNKVLDLGCGYGPVGIVVKHTYPEASVHMVDVNPRAVELAIINSTNNSVETEIKVSNVYENVEDKDYTTIITNPPIRAGKAVIYEMFDKSIDHLSNNGVLFVVIRKQQGAMSAKVKIESVFGNCDIIHKEKGYIILKAIKKVDNLI